MLFDDFIIVIVNGYTCHDTCLGPAAGSQFIDIITGRLVLSKNAVTGPFTKKAACTRIDLLIIGYACIVCHRFRSGNT